MQAVGQTRPGRLGDTNRPAATSAGTGGATGESPGAFIDHTLKGSRVVAFTKILGSHLPAGSYAAIDLDDLPNGDAIKDELERRTGKHTVPHIFIGGQFIGGADELDALESSGQLAARLGA
ncbi:hypothetical protein ABPG77_003673 [Micractinium sp. CCAP 211/92]